MDGMTAALRRRYGRGRLFNVAYHEAGHAVVAEHLGIHVGRIIKKPKREMTVQASGALILAMTKRSVLSPKLMPEATRHLICSFAGRIAEQIASGARVPATWHPYDTRHEQKLARIAGIGDLASYKAHARRILEEHWPKIEAVAALYLSADRVNGATLRRVL
jgi:hypothetical protein